MTAEIREWGAWVLIREKGENGEAGDRGEQREMAALWRESRGSWRWGTGEEGGGGGNDIRCDL